MVEPMMANGACAQAEPGLPNGPDARVTQRCEADASSRAVAAAG